MQINSTCVTKSTGAVWAGTWATLQTNGQVLCNANQQTWPPAGFLAAGAS